MLKRASGMTTAVRNLLNSFDSLPDGDKEELAAEIIRRSAASAAPPLTDEQLLRAADETFLQLDRSEEGDA